MKTRKEADEGCGKAEDRKRMDERRQRWRKLKEQLGGVRKRSLACCANNKMNVMELNSSEARSGRLTPVQLTATQTHGLLYVSRLQRRTEISAFLCVWHLKTVRHAEPNCRRAPRPRRGSSWGHREAEHETDAHAGWLAGVSIFNFRLHSEHSVKTREGQRRRNRVYYCTATLHLFIFLSAYPSEYRSLSWLNKIWTRNFALPFRWRWSGSW